MIHAVFCADAVERAAAEQIFSDAGLSVRAFGPDAVVRAEHFVAGNLQPCGSCEKGPGAFLVVAFPA
jgi:hypothetical protein